MIYDMSAKFPDLAGAYFMRYYIPYNTGNQDDFSKLLLMFKKNNKDAVNFMVDLVKKLPLEDYFSADLGIRVLASDELTAPKADGTIPLDSILIHCMPVKYIGYGYIRKRNHTEPLKNVGSKEHREEVLHNVYSYTHNVKHKSLLLVDDIITTGTTVREITRAIKKEEPDLDIYIFTLAKTKSKWGTDYPKLGKYNKDNSSNSTNDNYDDEYIGEMDDFDADLFEKINGPPESDSSYKPTDNDDDLPF